MLVPCSWIVWVRCTRTRVRVFFKITQSNYKSIFSSSFRYMARVSTIGGKRIVDLNGFLIVSGSYTILFELGTTEPSAKWEFLRARFDVKRIRFYDRSARFWNILYCIQEAKELWLQVLCVDRTYWKKWEMRVFSPVTCYNNVERFPEKRKYQFLRLTLRSIIARISHVRVVYLRTDIKFP